MHGGSSETEVSEISVSKATKTYADSQTISNRYSNLVSYLKSMYSSMWPSSIIQSSPQKIFARTWPFQI